MQATKISATTRTENGKGASRRLRAAGQLPAVTYAKGAAAQSLVVAPDDVLNVLNSAHGINSFVELVVDGKSINAMIGDYQYHPLSRKLLHADFIQVAADEKVDVKVPLRLEGKSKGIVLGGKLRVVFRELPLRCLASKIPTEIVHDISELDLDDHLAASELALPDGVEILLSEKRTVALVAADKRAKDDEDEEGDEKKPEAEAAAGDSK